jgi:hypothetical protein
MLQGRTDEDSLPKSVPSRVLRRAINTVVTSKSIITGLIFCCILVDPVVATFTWLYCQKTIVKREVNRQIIGGLDKDDLILLKFSKEESQTKLRWEHSREFEYNRQMYDVVKTMTLGDTVYYWCWLDHKETNLNRRLDELTAQTLGIGHKFREKQELFVSFFKSLYCPVSINWNLSIPESLYNQISLFLDVYTSITIQPLTPPPQSG